MKKLVIAKFVDGRKRSGFENLKRLIVGSVIEGKIAEMVVKVVDGFESGKILSLGGGRVGGNDLRGNHDISP